MRQSGRKRKRKKEEENIPIQIKELTLINGEEEEEQTNIEEKVIRSKSFQNHKFFIQMSTTKDNQAQRWGKLEDSYDNSELEGANPQQILHLMKEDTNITGR